MGKWVLQTRKSYVFVFPTKFSSWYDISNGGNTFIDILTNSQGSLISIAVAQLAFYFPPMFVQGPYFSLEQYCEGTLAHPPLGCLLLK